MKNFFNYALLFAAITTLSPVLVSCDDDGEPDDDVQEQVLSEGDRLLQKVLAADVSNTINPTYGYLADSCAILYTQLMAMTAGEVSQQQVNEACETFLRARANYEKSEAFLMGAAAHFGIDPHIDSWPLDLDHLKSYLEGHVENLDASVLGFHGIEFVLFRDGQPRKAAELNGYDTYPGFTKFNGATELRYAQTVAFDLRNSVFQLQCSWNEATDQERFDILDGLGKTYQTDKGFSYGQNLVCAGDNARSTYSSVKNAVSSVLAGDGGAANIANEVGQTKIKEPYSGNDENYIESPYSWNSLTDFQNNVRSIANVWYGGIEGKRQSGISFNAYFEKYNPEIAGRVSAAIQQAITEIGKIPYPFVKYITENGKATDKQGEKAIAACDELRDALIAANEFIQTTNR
ncbi:MAG: imelysin family protein [Prevotella sp.]